MLTVAPTESDIRTVLRAFLLAILPSGTECFIAQDNRVPEPQASDFVEMTPLFYERLATNQNAFTDVVFTGSIAGDTLMVTGISQGEISVGQTVFGVGITDGTKISALGTGTGAVGTYTVDTSQTVASETMSSGYETHTQNVRVTYQLDIHGPSSGNNAAVISTLFRDPYATTFFATKGFALSPLHADDPRQLAFINAEQQYENRWTLDAVMEAQMSVETPQDFADQVDLSITSVEAAYPA